MSLLAALLAPQPMGQPPVRPHAPADGTRVRTASAGDVVRERPPVEATPYADSVLTLTGRPRFFGDVADPVRQSPVRGTRLEGIYYARPDVALLARDASRPQSEWTLAHEMGHRVAGPHSPDATYRAAFTAKMRQPGMARPTGYAATSDNEHFAEAFANAVQVLRDGRAGLTARRRAAEQRIPATDTLVATLLAKPLYRGLR